MADNYSFGRSASLMDSIPGYEGRFNQQSAENSAGSQRLAAEAREYLNTNLPDYRDASQPQGADGASDIANRGLGQSLTMPDGFSSERNVFGGTKEKDPAPDELAKVVGTHAGVLACGSISYLLKSGPMITYSVMGGATILPQLSRDMESFGKSRGLPHQLKYGLATALDTVTLGGAFLAATQIGSKQLGPAVLVAGLTLRTALALNTRF